MSNKEKYRDFCTTEPEIPIFSKDWWLDSVCGEINWNVLLLEKDNKIVASMPYYTTKKMMLNMIFMPKLTQSMGPYIKYPSGQKYEKKLSYEKEVLTYFAKQLPDYDFFYQSFHCSIKNWLPFYWKGFKETTRYTYLLEDTSDIDVLWKNFRSNIKTDIKKAKKTITIDTSLGLENFFKINEMTFNRQNMSIPYNLDFLSNLHNRCLEYNSSKIYFALDDEDNIHAAVYIVWDSTTMYYLMSGGDPKFRNSGATSLLLWEAIQEASKMNLKFDFEGSMIEPIERIFRAFGAKQTPYFQLTKGKNKFINLLFQLLKG